VWRNKYAGDDVSRFFSSVGGVASASASSRLTMGAGVVVLQNGGGGVHWIVREAEGSTKSASAYTNTARGSSFTLTPSSHCCPFAPA